MREILFRGKRADNGEWKYGYYATVVLNGKLHSAIDTVFNNRFVTPTTVYPETVGQYTGLTDKNGKRIFEGDIFVSYEYGDKKYDLIGAIERRGASFILRSENYEDSQLNDYVEGTITHYKPNGERIVLESDIVQGEVIGNIYDNPELLEVER